MAVVFWRELKLAGGSAAGVQMQALDILIRQLREYWTLMKLKALSSVHMKEKLVAGTPTFPCGSCGFLTECLQNF